MLLLLMLIIKWSAGCWRIALQVLIVLRSSVSWESVQHSSQAATGLKGFVGIKENTTTADRGKEKDRRPRNQFQGICFNCGKKGHHAGEYMMSAKKKIENA